MAGGGHHGIDDEEGEEHGDEEAEGSPCGAEAAEGEGEPDRRHPRREAGEELDEAIPLA